METKNSWSRVETKKGNIGVLGLLGRLVTRAEARVAVAADDGGVMMTEASFPQVRRVNSNDDVVSRDDDDRLHPNSVVTSSMDEDVLPTFPVVAAVDAGDARSITIGAEGDRGRPHAPTD